MQKRLMKDHLFEYDNLYHTKVFPYLDKVFNHFDKQPSARLFRIVFVERFKAMVTTANSESGFPIVHVIVTQEQTKTHYVTYLTKKYL